MDDKLFLEKAVITHNGAMYKTITEKYRDMFKYDILDEVPSWYLSERLEYFLSFYIDYFLSYSSETLRNTIKNSKAW